MELEWSTFFLEIVNFLILVWLLSHFFYKPVIRIIDKRRDDIKKNIEAGETARTEANLLKQKYETRLSEWESEKSAARMELHDEIENERKRLLKDLQDELDLERKKESVINQRRLERDRKNNERRALEQGAVFSARLLSRLASQELETAIARLVIDEMGELTQEEKQILKSGHEQGRAGIRIYSAYPVVEEIREGIETSLCSITGTTAQCDYRLDPSLIAGIRIVIGSHLIEATLKDELKYFMGNNHVAD